MENPGVISLALDANELIVNEGGGVAEVTLVRSQGSDGTVTVDYRTFERSATADKDYTSVSGTAIFEDGETSQTILIPILEDKKVEGVERFSVTIDNATGGARLLAPRTALITIEDNDFFPGAKVFNGNQYLFLPLDSTWKEAQKIAEILGGNLVTINDRAEETWLRENFSDKKKLWIGINDAEVEGDFQWSSSQPVTYTNWAEGEPNNFLGIEDFGLINSNAAGEWNDVSGIARFKGIIEFGDSNPTPGSHGGVPELTRRIVVSDLTLPTAIDWTPDGETMFIAEKGGVIKAFVDGQLRDTPVIDFSERVNEFQDRGLIDIAVHPDFLNGSPYLYAVYTYDPPEVFDNEDDEIAGPDGPGNRAGRLGKFTVDLNTLTVIPGSEELIAGRNSTWENFNGFVDSTVDFDEPPALGIVNKVPDFLAADSVSHSVGSVEFGPDGALYYSNGDGTSFNQVDPRTVRVQELDNLSGKIMRIDPITGEGLADNPFYDGDPDSNQSRIYQYGFRNPVRFNVDPNTSDVYTGDVGWFSWEEVNRGEPGSNFGWPYFEGGSGTNLRTLFYQSLPEAQAFYDSGQVATPAILALDRFTGINAIIMGDTYRGDAYPPEFQGDVFFNDLGQGIVRNISFDEVGNISDVEVFVEGAENVVQIVQGPDDNLYFVDLDDGEVGLWEFAIEDVNLLCNATEGDDNMVSCATSDNDLINGLSGNDSILGQEGNDTLNGGIGNDNILGQDDDDLILGETGNDSLNGGTGNDNIFGQDDDDLIVGETGNDILNGGPGDDNIFGQDDDDYILGETGNDILNGGPGDDNIFGQDDDDYILGETGNDSLNGGPGDDNIFGQDDDDLIVGETGNDILNGGNGNDTLGGGTGNDTLTGGNGSDTFFLQVNQGVDSILDFVTGIDNLRLPDGLNFNDLMLTTNETLTAISFGGNNLAIVRGSTPIPSDFI